MLSDKKNKHIYNFTFILPFQFPDAPPPHLPVPAQSRPTVWHPHLVEILESHNRFVRQESGACKSGDIMNILSRMFLPTISYDQTVDL